MLGAFMGWGFVCALTGAAFGIVFGKNNLGQDHFVKRYQEQPWCESAKLQDQTYRRCWKAVEVKP